MTSRADIPVPERLLSHLVSAIVVDTARRTLDTWKTGDIVHLGDPFGEILVWLWQTDPDRAVRVFADLLAHIRKWEPGATREITLGMTLEGLPLALQGLDGEGNAALISRLRSDVPPLFEANPNSTT